MRRHLQMDKHKHRIRADDRGNMKNRRLWKKICAAALSFSLAAAPAFSGLAESLAYGAVEVSDIAEETEKERVATPANAEKEEIPVDTKKVETLAATKNTATPVNAWEDLQENPFGLPDDEMPASLEDTLGGRESLAVYAATGMEEEGILPNIKYQKSLMRVSYPFSIQYVTVSGKTAEFQITEEMDPQFGLLTKPFALDASVMGEAGEETGTLYGFEVLSLSIRVTDEETGELLQFYATEIDDSNFEYPIKMEMSDGSYFSGTQVWYKEDRSSDVWSALEQEDYQENGGALEIRLKRPYGLYGAFAERREVSGHGTAILIYTNEENLGVVPEVDMEALKQTLLKTQQFTEDDIEMILIPYGTDSSGEEKQKLWETLEARLKDQKKDDLAVIAYSGHGGYNADGSSYMALGGGNNIPATELKEHLSRYQGKMVLFMDCCFSGGLVIDGYAMEEAGTENALEQAQKEAGQFARQMAADLKNGDQLAVRSYQAGAERDNQFFIFTSASPYETSIQNNMLGGQLIGSIGHAMGYDRSPVSYSCYGADRNGDHQLTMKELTSFIRNRALISEPVFYPENDETVLFTYSEESGIPEMFHVKRSGSGTVPIVNDPETGKQQVTVDLEITNDAKNSLTFETALFSEELGTCIQMPGTIKDLKGYLGLEQSNRVMVNEESIEMTAEESSKLVSVTFSSWELEPGSQYFLRVYGVNEEGEGSFSNATFYTAKAAAEKPVDASNLQFKSPLQVADAKNAVSVSGAVPIRVQFDEEPTQTSGEAACKLRIDAYKQTRTADGGYTDDTAVDPITICDWVRPIHGRYDLGLSVDLKGSTYSCVWNADDVAEGIYRIRVWCISDENPDADSEIETFVNVT